VALPATALERCVGALAEADTNASRDGDDAEVAVNAVVVVVVVAACWYASRAKATENFMIPKSRKEKLAGAALVGLGASERERNPIGRSGGEGDPTIRWLRDG
jgi:hypothetical protein